MVSLSANNEAFTLNLEVHELVQFFLILELFYFEGRTGVQRWIKARG